MCQGTRLVRQSGLHASATTKVIELVELRKARNYGTRLGFKRGRVCNDLTLLCNINYAII